MSDHLTDASLLPLTRDLYQEAGFSDYQCFLKKAKKDIVLGNDLIYSETIQEAHVFPRRETIISDGNWNNAAIIVDQLLLFILLYVDFCDKHVLTKLGLLTYQERTNPFFNARVNFLVSIKIIGFPELKSHSIIASLPASERS